MSTLNLKPAHAPVKKYYATLQRFARGHFDKEGNIRGAFEALLNHCAHQYDWTLVPEYSIPRKDRNPLSVDGALLDAFNLPRGYWEAKDTKDSLQAEMKKKFEAGYPRSNILFQRPDRALLFQDGRIAFNDSIEDAEKLVAVLRLFFEWRQPDHDSWDRAASDFSKRIPEIARGVMKLIDEERRTNRVFVERFAAFAELCRESINPDLKDEAVEEMLVQHLLTERIFRQIFGNREFTRRNVIAAEIEKVIDSLTSHHFSRDEFLRELDPFYKAIEQAASTVEDYSQKQQFLNTIYERFFQGFNRKQADTHGIVYTPQPIVDFMVRSVEEILTAEFGRSLSDEGVHIIDPFVGTGTFITGIMQQIKKTRIQRKYRSELHCNEVMLLPYYIASMNVEHAFLDATGEYEPFEGICLVDTFELAEPRQAEFEYMSEGNTARIRKQKKAPIFVVIGNPPYNMGQANENDQNKNRKYKHIDARVQETYLRASTATLRNKLSDPYVKAFRWACDRIRPGGVVAFVSNNSFLDNRAFDGMRKYLHSEFTSILHLDLRGNARTSGVRRKKEGGNIFDDQIRVGIGITILVNNPQSTQKTIKVYSVGDYLKSDAKRQLLREFGSMHGVPLVEITPDKKNDWLTKDQCEDFDLLIPVGDKQDKGEERTEAIFRLFSLGVAANRDPWVYAESAQSVADHVGKMIGFYEETRLSRMGASPSRRTLPVQDRKIKWTDRLIDSWNENRNLVFVEDRVRRAIYRPFNRKFLYFDHLLNQRRYQQHHFFPKAACETENVVICSNVSPQISGYYCLASNVIPDLHFVGDSQCFPFYTYDEDGTNRRDNITDWALAEFRSHYGQKSITKLDIFHCTYALLHHPEYRTRYAANLKRELPRIPFAPAFAEYARIGEALMKLHLEYEQQPEYPLERTETGKLDWRVEKMSLSKDKTQLKYNEFLTLSGIPPEVYEYRLGNRSALEWVIDQYRVSTDKRSGIVNDPNRDDDPEYIVRLIGQVVTVSLETVRLVRELSTLLLLPATN